MYFTSGEEWALLASLFCWHIVVRDDTQGSFLFQKWRYPWTYLDILFPTSQRIKTCKYHKSYTGGNETTNWIRFLDLKIKSESRVQDLYITKDCHYLEEFSEAKTFL